MSYRIILTIFLLTLQILYAQEDEFKDIVVLLEGNRVVGKITEILPGEQVTIQTRAGSTFTFKTNQIKTILRYGIPGAIDFTKSTNETIKKTQQLPPPKVDSSKAQTDKPAKPKVVWDQTPKRSTPQKYYEPVVESTDEPKFRINVEGGYSYRTAEVSGNVPADFKSYIEKLKSGYNIAANFTYFFGEEYGICFHFSRFMTSNSVDGVVVYDIETGNILGVGKMENNISIAMYGVGLAQRKFLSESILLYASGILGLATYSDDWKLPNKSVEIEGSAFALSGLVGLDFKLDPNWAAGLDILYLLGTVSNFKVNGKTADLGKESLNRFDVNIGLKYFFY